MKKRTPSIIIAAVIVAAAGYMIAQQMQSATISSQEVYKVLNDTSIVLLDVRTMPEHLNERIKETPLIPVQELEQRLSELDQYKGKKIIVYCRTDNRSGYATSLLRKNGFDAYNMTGGIVRWKMEKLPTISGAVK
ncbi:MAG: rhodanese-like domain-containing protein [Bacteroidota bacterium]